MKFNNFLIIHRKILNWEWFKESKTLHLFIYFLIKANYKAKKWKGINIERGEFITSYGRMSNDTGLTISEIRTRLKRLTQTEEIIKKSTNEYTKIKVCNYNRYQFDNSSNDNQKTSPVKTSRRNLKILATKTTNTLKSNSVKKKDSNQQDHIQTNHNQTTTTNKDIVNTKTIPSNQDLPEKYLELSLFFHKQQKQNGFYHKDFQHELSYESKIVINGASIIDKLIRLDQEDFKDIEKTLNFVLNNNFWKKNVISLNSIRKKSRSNGNTKYFNIKNSMVSKDQTKTYTLSEIHQIGIGPDRISELFKEIDDDRYIPNYKGNFLLNEGI